MIDPAREFIGFSSRRLVQPYQWSDDPRLLEKIVIPYDHFYLKFAYFIFLFLLLNTAGLAIGSGVLETIIDGEPLDKSFIDGVKRYVDIITSPYLKYLFVLYVVGSLGLIAQLCLQDREFSE